MKRAEIMAVLEAHRPVAKGKADCTCGWTAKWEPPPRTIPYLGLFARQREHLADELTKASRR